MIVRANPRILPATLSAAVLATALAAAAPARAQSFEYAFRLESGQSVAYDMELEAVNPGSIRVEAIWPGNRLVSLRLEPVGGGEADAVRRSGRSPQVLEVQVDGAGEATPSRWVLTIRGVPAREAAQGTLRVELPYPVPEVDSTLDDPGVEEVPPPGPDGPAPDPRRARTASPPAGAPATWRELSERTDQFGAALRADAGPDSCRWQDGFEAFLERRRAALFSGAGTPDDQSLRALADLRSMIDRVDALRTSDDPVLAGPPPDDPRRRLAWDRVRQTRMIRLEEELDGLSRALRRSHAPWLEDEEWPARLVGCLTACQRHFDERVLRGPSQAINYDLARAQWDRILLAATAMDALIDLRPAERAAN